MNNQIIDKLQKLLRHEESARAIGSLNEASAFAGKIQNLLIANQLSMSDIEIGTEIDIDEKIESEVIDPMEIGQKRAGKMVRWQQILLRGLASVNNCATLVTRGSNYQHVVGLSADRQITVALYQYFLQLAQDLCDRAFKEHKESEDYIETLPYLRAAHSRQWKESYLRGFSQTIANRLYETKKEAVKVAEQDIEKTQALVHLRDKDKMVRDYIDSGNFRTIHHRGSNTNHKAYRAGSSAGQSVSLSGKTLNA